jgi:hypothetical protein
VRHVRFGSLADIKAWIRDVRFTPESGHSSERVGCPLSARTHAVQQTKTLFDHLVGAREQCRWFSRPSAIAVVRLNMRSNLVGCSTGI